MNPAPPILCAGSAHWDHVARACRPLDHGADVPGRIARHPGGVALRIALALAADGGRVGLLSVVGQEPEGNALLTLAAASGIDTAHVHRSRAPTGRYVAIETSTGALHAAVADCGAVEAETAALLAPLRDGRLGSAPRPFAGVLVVDGNIAPEALDAIPADPAFGAARLALVSPGTGKAARLRRAMTHARATLYLNRREAEALVGGAFDDARAAATALLRLGAPAAVVTDGPRHAAAATAQGCLTRMPPARSGASVTGAGDTFVAAHLRATLSDLPAEAALEAAIAAAAEHLSAATSA